MSRCPSWKSPCARPTARPATAASEAEVEDHQLGCLGLGGLADRHCASAEETAAATPASAGTCGRTEKISQRRQHEERAARGEHEGEHDEPVHALAEDERGEQRHEHGLKLDAEVWCWTRSPGLARHRRWRPWRRCRRASAARRDLLARVADSAVVGGARARSTAARAWSCRR